MKLFKVIISALFPDTCVGCGEILENGDSLCEYCHEFLERTAKDRLCSKCGLPKKSCDCSKYIFRFDGCVAPFYNKGIAKELMNEFKFRKKERYAKFLASQMALSVKQAFPDIVFDGVAFVPMLAKNKLKRGYNQSELLATEISNILGLPIYRNLLGAKPKAKSQHDTPIKERFDNVNGRYYCKQKLNGRNILLVDDIKTTGATLDECSKHLLRGGANSIYCVTGLIGYKRRKEEKKNGN